MSLFEISKNKNSMPIPILTRPFNYAIPAAKFFPLILFHSNPNDVTKDKEPVTIAITKTLLTALLYASNTKGNISELTIVLTPVAPASMIVVASTPGIRAVSSFTRRFDNTELEIARNIAPLNVSLISSVWVVR